ncbi:hypothetical protein OG552_08820 [Streptomyces sp. NBC_01476]|uniref:hypothetical protein n=1 Tax=Streptomyces sp. NBC_01476 TaxID=2903881 RepID=UPI002E37FB31|nr:hypothetical protein [Streptomyces sp. NBC_01476]
MSIDPPVVLPSSSLAEPDSLEQLIGDCRHMAQHWKTPAAKTGEKIGPAGLHGITVPPSSVHVVDGMAEFGD